MKRFLPFLVSFLFFCSPSARAVNVRIIESEIIMRYDTMDRIWWRVCTNLGYHAAIYPQATLDSNYWFGNTDVLIISSGITGLLPNRTSTIQSYLMQGGRVYLQCEYDCSNDSTDHSFQQIVNACGGSFNWLGSSAGNLSPMMVSGSLNNTPDTVTSLPYFWYGCFGSGVNTTNRCNSHIEPFLQWNGQYFGFIFCVPGINGARMITTSDEDWINQLISIPLMNNIAINLASPAYNCQVPGSLNVNLSPDTSICVGDTVVLNVSASGATSYLWSTGATASLITVNTPGTYWVKVSNSSCTTSDTIHVRQKEASINIVLSDSEICQGNSAMLTISDAISASISPAFSVNWQDSTHATLQPDSTTSYLLIAKTGCGNYDTANILLNVYPGIIAHIETDSSILCPGDSAKICAFGNFISYAWNISDSTNCIYASQAGDYYVTVKDSNQCTAESNHVVLAVYPAPSVSITIKGDTLSSFNAVSYQWYLNDSPIPGATASIYIANDSGNYTVAIVDTNGCRTKSTPISFVANGFIDPSPNQVEIYPNPSSVGTWRLTVGSELVGNKLEIYDNLGQVVLRSVIRNPKSNLSLDISRGVYFLRIYSDKATILRRLIRL